MKRKNIKDEDIVNLSEEELLKFANTTIEIIGLAAYFGMNHNLSIFHYGVKKNFINLINKILECDVSKLKMVNMPDLQEQTPLFNAVIDKLEITKILIANGANVNAKDINGDTPLIFAVIYNNFESTKLLLSNGANPNIRNNKGETPIFNAVRDMELVELLIKYKAILDIKNKEGVSLLEHTIKYGTIGVFDLLLKNLEITSDYFTVLFATALEEEDQEKYKYLIDYGKHKGFITLSSDLQIENIYQSNNDSFEENALKSKRSDIDKIAKKDAMLLEIYNIKGAEYLQDIVKTSNLISYAINSACYKLAHVLIQNKEGVNKLDETGRTPIFYAVSKNKIEFVKSLIEAGAYLNITDNEGCALIEYAAICIEDFRILEVILQKSDILLENIPHLIDLANGKGKSKLVAHLISFVNSAQDKFIIELKNLIEALEEKSINIKEYKDNVLEDLLQNCDMHPYYMDSDAHYEICYESLFEQK